MFWWKKKKKKKRKKRASSSNEENAQQVKKSEKVDQVSAEDENEKEEMKAENDQVENEPGSATKEKPATRKEGEAASEKSEEAADEETPVEVAAFTTSNLKLVPSNCQHIGARERQEDAFGFSDLSDEDLVKQNGVLAVVADGMGGLAKGDRASQVAVSIFLREYKERQEDEPLNKHLLSTLQRSNTAVYDLAFTGDEDDELGTTLVAAAVQDGEMHWISVGDSRIYLYRNSSLEQLNKDHIYANKLENDVENGLISRKEAEKHPERAFLTSYLGCHEPPEVDYSEEPVSLKPGDAVMLCSDGLTNTLSLDEIIDVFNASPENIAEELVKNALFKEKRHQDNITILVLTCKEVDE